MQKAILILYMVVLALGNSIASPLFVRPSLIPVEMQGRWGYCGPDRVIKIQPAYDATLPFHDGLGVFLQNGRMGAIDAMGNVVFKPAYDILLPGKLVRLRNGGRYALANNAGKLLTRFVFEEVTPRHGDLYEVRLGSYLGMVDTAGQWIVPMEYQDIRNVRDVRGVPMDLLMVYDGSHWGLFNHCGEQVQKARYDDLRPFSCGYAITVKDGKFGMINSFGEEVIPCLYENLHPMREGRAAAMVKGNWGFLDEKGRECVGFKYQAVQSAGFCQGRSAVLQDGTWRLIDRQGRSEMSIPGNYSFVGPMAEGLIAAGVLDGSVMRYGYLDLDAKVVIPYKFSYASAFTNGFAVVGFSSGESLFKSPMSYGIINRKGKLVVPGIIANQGEAFSYRDELAQKGWIWMDGPHGRCRYDLYGHRSDCEKESWYELAMRFKQIRCESQPIVAVMDGEKWGFVTQNGTEITDCKYKMVECFHDGLAKVWPLEGGNYYFVDGFGTEYNSLNTRL